MTSTADIVLLCVAIPKTSTGSTSLTFRVSDQENVQDTIAGSTVQTNVYTTGHKGAPPQ